MKTLLKVLLGVVIVFVALFIKEFFFTKDKLQMMRQDIIHHYYDENKLTEIIKNELGDKYEGDLETDFDNFVLTLVLNQLSKYESVENQRYNSFLSIKEMSEFDELRKEEAAHTEGYSLEEEIYYLKINQFLNGETYKKIEEMLSDMEQHSDLIIDLRDSSGGNFEELKRISNLFLEPGSHLYSLKTRDKEKAVYLKNNEPLRFEKIVLLINNQTASVSELFALALKENNKNVTLIGTETYGKNISYSIRRFKDKSAMIFISSIMEGPNQQQFDSGVLPDIYEGFDKAVYEGLSPKESEVKKNEEKKMQLNKAIEFLEEGSDSAL